MKISCLPWRLLADKPDFTIEHWCDLAGSCGLDGVDLMDAFLNRETRCMFMWKEPDAGQMMGTLIQSEMVERWCRASKANGLNLSTLTIHNTMFCYDDASRDREMGRICTMLDLARQLGISTVRPISGLEFEGPDANAKLCSPQSPDVVDTKMRAIIEMCRRLVPEAKKRGLKLAFEPHPGVTRDIANVVRLFEEVKDETFGLQFDGKHVNCPPAMALSHPKLLSRLTGIHIDNYTIIDPAGIDHEISLANGVLKFDEMLLLLRSIDYKGWLTIEYCGTNEAHIRESVDFIKGLSRQYGLLE